MTSLTATVILLNAACLTACKSVQNATSSTASHAASELRRDSIFLHDSVFVLIRADTVYLERWHTRWRDREIIRTDTLTVENIRTRTVQVRYVPRFYKYCTAAAILLLLILSAKLALRAYRRFRL